jgi:hypothetical protein
MERDPGHDHSRRRPAHRLYRPRELTRSLFCVALILTPLSDAAAQQTPARDPSRSTTVGSGVVRGRVVADAADSPLVRARVVARPDGAPALEAVFTDADGRFVLDGLPAAHYTLTITKTGYVWTKLGGSGIDRSLGFQLAERASVDLNVRMAKAAAISGRIVDELGEPVLAASVLAGTVQRQGGKPRFQAVRAGLTDDRGEFRIGGLSSGTYLLAVSAEIAGTPLPGAPEEWRRNITWPQTFYPSATDLNAAQSITLSVGEERSSMDIVLRPAAGVGGRFLFTVTDAAGRPAAGQIRLMGEFYDQVVRVREGRATTQPISPGIWNIVAQGAAGVATTTISLESGDVDVPLVLAKGGRMSGRITLDNGRPFDAGRYGLTLELTFNDRRRMAATVMPVTFRPDGTFEFENLFGRVDFVLDQSVSPLYRLSFKSITHEGRNLLDEPFEFGSSENLTGVHVVLSPQSIQLTGLILDADRMPAVGCFAVAFPEDPLALRTGRLTRRVPADLDGRFRLTGLPAGSYYVATTRQLESVDWAHPNNIDSLRAHASRVALGEGVTPDITLECANP